MRVTSSQDRARVKTAGLIPQLIVWCFVVMPASSEQTSGSAYVLVVARPTRISRAARRLQVEQARRDLHRSGYAKPGFELDAGGIGSWLVTPTGQKLPLPIPLVADSSGQLTFDLASFKKQCRRVIMANGKARPLS